MNVNKLIAVAAIAASAAIPFAANAAYTQTVTQMVDNVKWQFKIDTSAKTAQLGVGSGAGEAEAAAMACLEGMPSSLVLPQTFTVDGVIYKVNAIAARAFPRGKGGTLKNITFPLNVNMTFKSYTCVATAIQNALFKGLNTVANGDAQAYTTITMPSVDYSILRDCQKVEFVVMGPNLKIDNKAKMENFLHRTSNATVLVPRSSGNMTWDGCAEISLGGSSNKVIYYGPSEEFDIKMGSTSVTLIPTTSTAFTNVLTYAQTFKLAFGLDAKINVTNTIEIGEGLITEDTLKYATFDSLMFAVKTQAQLDIIKKFPASAPISIDPTGLTENMIIPKDYPNVYVKTVPGVTVKRTASGFVIIVN